MTCAWRPALDAAAAFPFAFVDSGDFYPGPEEAVGRRACSFPIARRSHPARAADGVAVRTCTHRYSSRSSSAHIPDNSERANCSQRLHNFAMEERRPLACRSVCIVSPAPHRLLRSCCRPVHSRQAMTSAVPSLTRHPNHMRCCPVRRIHTTIQSSGGLQFPLALRPHRCQPRHAAP